MPSRVRAGPGGEAVMAGGNALVQLTNMIPTTWTWDGCVGK